MHVLAADASRQGRELLRVAAVQGQLNDRPALDKLAHLCCLPIDQWSAAGHLKPFADGTDLWPDINAGNSLVCEFDVRQFDPPQTRGFHGEPVHIDG